MIRLFTEQKIGNNSYLLTTGPCGRLLRCLGPLPATAPGAPPTPWPSRSPSAPAERSSSSSESRSSERTSLEAAA